MHRLLRGVPRTPIHRFKDRLSSSRLSVTLPISASSLSFTKCRSGISTGLHPSPHMKQPVERVPFLSQGSSGVGRVSSKGSILLGHPIPDPFARERRLLLSGFSFLLPASLSVSWGLLFAPAPRPGYGGGGQTGNSQLSHTLSPWQSPSFLHLSESSDTCFRHFAQGF